jgi:hypothetical protein
MIRKDVGLRTIAAANGEPFSKRSLSLGQPCRNIASLCGPNVLTGLRQTARIWPFGLTVVSTFACSTSQMS